MAITTENTKKAADYASKNYTAESLDSYKTAYNDYMAQWMNSNDAYNKASELLVKNTPTETSTTTPTDIPEQTTPEVKQETIKTEQETVGSTVPEIKQEWELKPLSQEYYNQTSDDAQSKIISNLNNYRQTNPEYFRDYESFKKNFSYDARNDEQKQTLDSWYGGYQKWMELAWIPVTDLYTQYKDGQISMNELENLRVYDPTKYAELQNQINKWNIIAAYDDDKWVDTTWMNLQDMAYTMAAKMFNEFMSGDSSSGASQYFRDYEAKMDSPEMLALSDQCTEVQEQMENIQSDLDSIKKSVEAEYEWTWATRSKINAIIADRSYDLQLQLRTLNSEYNKYATQYNNRMQQYQNEFQMQLQEYQLNQDARNQQMKELWFAMDLMNFETNEQKAQREWDYWVKQQEYANWNINSKDYQTRYKAALNSVQNLLSQYEWIPMVRSAEQMADDILKAIDNWSTLGAELTKINKQIQQKPEYKYLYNNTFKPASSGQNIQSYTIWDTEYVVYNGEMMTAADFNSKYWGKAVWSTGEAKPYDLVDAKVFSQEPINYGYNTLWSFLLDKKEWANGWWCGRFVNEYLKSIGVTNENYYDNDLSTKLNSVNTKVPKEWSIAVFDYGHITAETGQNHGHVAIVTKVYEDWSFDVIESNFNSDKKIWTRQHINPQSSTVKGFFDPSQPPAWSNTSNTTLVSWSIEWVPLAYERAVKNLVPAALQNSDAEREDLNTIITNSYNGWIDQSEIALKFMGFDIKNDDDKTLATDLVNTIRTLSTDTQEWIVQTISDMMNQGNYYKAIQTVENAVTKQAKEAWNYGVSESAVKNTINRSNELANYVNGLESSPVGVVEWNMQQWLNSYASKDAKKIANLTALIESSLDIKDKETLQRIVPQLTDQPSVFMSKLENLNNSLMSELNWWRNIYGLPSLTNDALSNPTKRVDLYRNWQSTVQSTNQSTLQNTQSSSFTPSWATKYLNISSTWGWSTVNVNWNYYPSDFYSNN